MARLELTTSPQSRTRSAPNVLDRDDGDARVHLVLARRRRRAERHGLVSVLCGRHRRELHRQDRAVVHSRDHDPRLRGPIRVHRELQHVRPRRRLPSRQRGDGLDAREVLGLGADVRLHPHRPDQRRLCGSLSDRSHQRAARSQSRRIHGADERDGRVLRDSRHDLFLVGEHQRAFRNRARRRSASCTSRPSWS